MSPTLWTALITPFRNGEVDLKTLDALLARQAANGVLLLGTTGEGLSLTHQERKTIVLHALKTQPQIPFMVAATDMLFAPLLEWVSFCNDLPIKALLMCVPPYTKPGPCGQYDWFARLLDRTNHPVMLYNNPGRTGGPLFEETLARLQHHPRLWSFKDCSGSVAQFKAYRQAAPNLSFASGDDNMLAHLAPLGAQCLVSVAANIWPRAMQTFVTQALQGTPPDLTSVWEAFVGASNPIPTKAFLQALGIISSGELRPPLSLQDFHNLGALEQAHQRMESL